VIEAVNPPLASCLMRTRFARDQIGDSYNIHILNIMRRNNGAPEVAFKKLTRVDGSCIAAAASEGCNDRAATRSGWVGRRIPPENRPRGQRANRSTASMLILLSGRAVAAG
jgi:hypothetical protein